MTLWFSIEVRFLNRRYHGRDPETRPEWPPTPLRLFEAITAGALSGRWSTEDRPATEAALRWLEALGPPEIVLAPAARGLRPYRLAIPNNQADRHVAALRKGAHLDKLLAADKELKVVWAWIVGRAPLIYAWPISDDLRCQAQTARAVVRRLVTLGTGLDHAVADIRLATERPVATDLASFFPGISPCAGTLDSLVARHKAQLERLKTGSLRENRPPVRYHPAAPPARDDTHLLFAFRAPTGVPDQWLPVEPEATAVVAHAIRLKLANRLVEALRHRPESAPGVSPEQVERLVIGRGAGPADKGRRISVSPLPSIGHEHADGLLRRVLVSVPGCFPLPAIVVRRALGNSEFDIELSPAQSVRFRLIAIEDLDSRERAMRARYLGPARIWRSVSPVVLTGRRHCGPIARPSGVEGEAEALTRGDERLRADEEAPFRRALENAGVAEVAEFRLRREPFGPHQPRSDANWGLPVTQDDQRRAWLSGRPRVHVEITFHEAKHGPILIGDGRFIGLGLFRAVRDEPPGRAEAARYQLGTRGRPRVQLTVRIADVLRRALMSGGSPPPEISGHDEYGPMRADPAHAHAFFMPEDADGDGLIDHITVYSRRGFSDDSLDRLNRLRRLWWLSEDRSTPGNGVDLVLEGTGRPDSIAGLVRLIGPSRVWRSETPYFRPRFSKRTETEAGSGLLAIGQIQREWAARYPSAPAPAVERLGKETRRQMGARFEVARTDRDRFAPDKQGSFLELRFPRPIVGPISLGRSAHYGLGRFVAVQAITAEQQVTARDETEEHVSPDEVEGLDRQH